MKKVTATFSVDEDVLIEKYNEYYGITDFSDALRGEFEVMEENGVSLIDWREEKPEEKHYAVMCDYAMTDSVGTATNGVIAMAVAHTLDEAKMRLANLSSADRDFVKANEWKIKTDASDEFDAGSISNYDGCHVRFFIVEV